VYVCLFGGQTASPVASVVVSFMLLLLLLLFWHKKVQHCGNCCKYCSQPHWSTTQNLGHCGNVLSRFLCLFCGLCFPFLVFPSLHFATVFFLWESKKLIPQLLRFPLNGYSISGQLCWQFFIDVSCCCCCCC